MSNSEEGEIKVQKAAPKLTPPGYDVVLDEEQSQLIAEFVDSPVFKTLDRVFVRQRLDQIARMCLNAAQTTEDVKYYKGLAAELVLFFSTMKKVKRAYLDATQKDMDKNEKTAKK